ncbi:MAG: sulfatase-like hydrolase/transferase [Planctomycetes bacterium]|nr:sulfatase-like hydrolase/transferase [Planctomycetota bacterium]
MNRRDFLKSIGIFSLGIGSQLSAKSSFTRMAGESPKRNSRPNIVFILADDFGYSSLNSYGADKNLVRTPHIDRIADAGMRFTQAYTPASVCSPTRYGFLTGRYPWRTSLKSGVVNLKDPLLPNPDRVTIADWLKERGYNTAAIGKWHLGYGERQRGRRVNFTEKWSPGPLDLGFDYHFGVPQNHGDNFGVYIENDHIYGLRSKKVQPYSKSFYGHQYMGFDAPQRENKNVMADLTDKTVEWLKQQSKNKPFFLYFAAVAVHHPITPSDYMRGLSDCGPYGDFIQDLDLSTGRILETLKYMNLMDDTIVIFSSDNGGDIPRNAPSRPENQAIKHGLEINGKLRCDKHTIWEGGTRVPFIVSWPGKVKENTVSNDMISSMDIFATVCEITDGKLPNSKDVAPDSFSFLPSLLHSKKAHRRISMITADVKGIQAIRKGNWKYIDNTSPKGKKEGKAQLYDLANDPSENVDLYDKKPEIVKELSDELDRIRRVQSSR